MPSVLRQVQRLAAHVERHARVVHAVDGDAGGGVRRGADRPSACPGATRRCRSFLHRLRVQAGTNGGRIHANGRLFDVADGRPHARRRRERSELTASIQLAAFVYTGAPLPVADTTTTTTDAADRTG